MPRKKVPPPPLDDAFQLPSGRDVEVGSVEALAHRTTGKGRDQVIKYRIKNDRILKHVFDHYFVPTDGKDGHREYRIPKDDYLRNPSAFANHISNTHLADPNGPDTRSLRINHYPEIKRHIEALKNALKDKCDNV